MDRIARYIEIWDKLRAIPINDRPAVLRDEFDDIWLHFTEAEKVRLDKALEIRD